MNVSEHTIVLISDRQSKLNRKQDPNASQNLNDTIHSQADQRKRGK